MFVIDIRCFCCMASVKFPTFPRREGVSYPQIYSRFKVKARDSDDVEEFRIQDLTENYFDQAVNFIVENHARGAVFHRACKTLHNESGIERVSNSYRKVFEEKISLICIKVGSEEVVGLNALHIKSRFDAPPDSDDPNFRILIESLQYIEDAFRLVDHYQVDYYMFAAGLCVDKNFRGRGIATEILKARAGVLKAIGLSVTSSVFSTVGAQKAAASAGYDENYSITYEELGKLFPQIDFSFAHGTTCKVLSLKI